MTAARSPASASTIGQLAERVREGIRESSDDVELRARGALAELEQLAEQAEEALYESARYLEEWLQYGHVPGGGYDGTLNARSRDLVRRALSSVASDDASEPAKTKSWAQTEGSEQ